MLKTVLFDFDGTVFDTVEGITKSVQYALERIGIEAGLNELRCFAGPPLKDMFMKKYALDAQTAELCVRYFRERYVPVGIHESRPFNGVEKMLEGLITDGYSMAITTLKPEVMAEQLLKEHDMRKYFSAVVGVRGENDQSTKCDMINRAMSGLGSDKEYAILVGDTAYDIYGAHEAGIKAIGAGYGYGMETELEEAGADYIARSVEDVAMIIRYAFIK